MTNASSHKAAWGGTLTVVGIVVGIVTGVFQSTISAIQLWVSVTPPGLKVDPPDRVSRDTDKAIDRLAVQIGRAIQVASVRPHEETPPPNDHAASGLHLNTRSQPQPTRRELTAAITSGESALPEPRKTIDDLPMDHD